MKTDLPESLHPLASNHPAGCAWRILLSPEEWTWTQAEVEAMARAVVALNTERIALRKQRNDLKSSLLEAVKENTVLRAQLEHRQMLLEEARDHLNKEVAESNALRKEAALLLGIAVAAGEWWQGHRPLKWTKRQHLQNPEVNVSHGKWLARAVAAWHVSVSAKALDAARKEAKP